MELMPDSYVLLLIIGGASRLFSRLANSKYELSEDEKDELDDLVDAMQILTRQVKSKR